MKKRATTIIAILTGVTILVASGITAANLFKRDRIEGDIAPDAPTAKIESFHYDYGSYFGGYHYYTIEKDDGKMMLNGAGGNGVNIDIDKEISKKELEELQELIIDNKIYDWDGFNKNDNDVLDGYDFKLTIKYTDGREIVAEGYEEYPDGYVEAHQKLTEFLESLE